MWRESESERERGSRGFKLGFGALCREGEKERRGWRRMLASDFARNLWRRRTTLVSALLCVCHHEASPFYAQVGPHIGPPMGLTQVPLSTFHLAILALCPSFRMIIIPLTSLCVPRNLVSQLVQHERIETTVPKVGPLASVFQLLLSILTVLQIYESTSALIPLTIIQGRECEIPCLQECWAHEKHRLVQGSSNFR